MGWGDCGEDRNGRPIGYIIDATCDHEGCDEEIDRGLSYSCGGMHGEDEFSCDKYFCSKHLSYAWKGDGNSTFYDKEVCSSCAKILEEEGDKVSVDKNNFPNTLQGIKEYLSSLTPDDLEYIRKKSGILNTWDGWYWVEEDGLPKKEMEVGVLYEDKQKTPLIDFDMFDANDFHRHDNVKAWKPVDIQVPEWDCRRSVSSPPMDDDSKFMETFWGECMSEKENMGQTDSRGEKYD